MAVITAGNDPVDRASSWGNIKNAVDVNHRFAAPGTVTEVQAYFNTQGSGTIGIMREGAPGVFSTVHHATYTLQPVGLFTMAVEWAVEAGDCIAICHQGKIDFDVSGAIGCYYTDGDKLVGDQQNVTLTPLATYQISLYATGTTQVIPSPIDDSCEGIAAWLDAIEAGYVPCVDDWLAAN